MTVTTIIGTTKGAPDNSQASLLHLYNQTLGTGARAAIAGTGTGLVLWANSIGFVNVGGFKAKFETPATADRTFTLPDATGTLTLGDGTGITDPIAFKAALNETRVILSSDFATTADTAQAVSGFTLSLEASKTYHLKAVLRVQSASDSNGLQPRFTGPGASLSYLTAIARAGAADRPITGFDVDATFSSVEAAATPEIMVIEGLLSTNGTTPVSALGLSIKSENNGTEVTLLAGSIMTLTKLD